MTMVPIQRAAIVIHANFIKGRDRQSDDSKWQRFGASAIHHLLPLPLVHQRLWARSLDVIVPLCHPK
eukprot:scaffold172210_cov33-Prasinocladus_malaysianus.AAC.1